MSRKDASNCDGGSFLFTNLQKGNKQQCTFSPSYTFAGLPNSYIAWLAAAHRPAIAIIASNYYTLVCVHLLLWYCKQGERGLEAVKAPPPLQLFRSAIIVKATLSEVRGCVTL